MHVFLLVYHYVVRSSVEYDSITMDPELARRLFAEGTVLVLLDVPERTEFGIDYNCWSVGPRFKGIKMIPPGLHLVYYWCGRTVVLGRMTNRGNVARMY